MSAYPPGLELGRITALTDHGAIAVRIEHEGRIVSVLLTRKGDCVAAFRNACPHAGYPLQRADGRVIVQDGRYIVCAAHGASFTLERGECAGGPCNGEGLQRIAILVRDGAIYTA